MKNKLHWAMTRQTAAEIIYSRADSNKQNMGLTNWKNAPDGAIRKSDVSIAKNYLNERELDGLNRIVSMYLDYAELQVSRRKVMYMEDWVKRLDAFLQFNEHEILNHAGAITAQIAKSFAESEFQKYSHVQDSIYESDFDKMLKLLEEGKAIYGMREETELENE